MTVYLVGAGPGDPGLLTLRGRELLARCDAVVYDRLADARIVGMANAAAERHDAGKRAGHHAMSQEEINGLLVELARRHATVVRLKGGDPFIFGRGGEEALALEQAGVAFEIVPGISSAYAVPAYAGIPVTQRGMAAQVTIVTGHEDPEKAQSDLDWTQLAHTPGTLVLLMGVGALAENMGRLVEQGMDGGTPAAVIASGTRPSQRTVVGTVATIANLAARARIRPPAITLVGAVAALRDRLAWFERRPLFGCSVVVTRARAQASGLAARLADLGAEVVEAPAIRIRRIEDVPLPDPRGYDLLCVTSPNGVEMLFEHLRDARGLADVKVAAIGPGTARALRAHGVEPDVVPERAVAEGLVEALRDVPVRRALIARAAEGRDVLPDALRARGAEVDVVALYETVAEPLTDGAREAAAAADYLLFTSASSVRFYAAAGGSLAGPRLASIGPATSAELRAHGAEPAIEADPHTPDGLIAAIVADAGP
jgi:uroporphyrinogen III methyltransferase / synthase